MFKNKALLLVVGFLATDLYASQEAVNSKFEVRLFNYLDHLESESVCKLLDSDIDIHNTRDILRGVALEDAILHENKNNIICICKSNVNNEICAILFCELKESCAMYSYVLVLADYRRKKIATQMMQFVENICLQRSVKKIIVVYPYSWRSDTAWIIKSCFSKVGFKEMWQNFLYWLLNNNLVIMYKNIA